MAEGSGRPAIGIVGASLAGLHAACELRRLGFAGELTIIGAETEMPYDRPPLSKEILDGSWQPEQARLSTEAAIGARWCLGEPAVSLDVEARRVTLAGGHSRTFNAGIVIATGATPRRLKGSELAGVHVIRTLADSLALTAELESRPARVAIVGFGFIGAEVASSCRRRGLEVTVIEALAAPLEGVLGPEVGGLLADLHRAGGVDLKMSAGVEAFVAGPDGRVAALRLSDGSVVSATVVVMAVGVEPSTAWLKGSSLTLEAGVACDETTLAAPAVVVAGDVASWPSRRFQRRRRVEHWDNAIRQGRHAAARLLAAQAGAAMVYDPVPWFWSDQFGHKLQLIGVTDGYEEVLVLPHAEQELRPLVLYRRGAELIGAFAIGRAKAIVRCRALLEMGTSWDAAVRELAA